MPRTWTVKGYRFWLYLGVPLLLGYLVLLKTLALIIFTILEVLT